MSMSYGGDTINDTDGGVLRPISSVMRNRIINGDMRIDQRNNGASVTPNGSYTLDRWTTENNVTSKFTVQQVNSSVVGFTKALRVTSSSSYSSGSSDYFNVNHRIEGFNIADLAWGTSNAKPVTLSFKVRSSLTGTFSGAIQNSGASRSYPFTYSIPSANTDTSISVTIPGDTSGTWLNTNGMGMQICFDLGSGSLRRGTAGVWAADWLIGATGAVALLGTSGATLEVTGVQLEKGTQATGFEYRQYGTELALCQRYFEQNDLASFNGCRLCIALSNQYAQGFYYIVPKRASPTVTLYNRNGTVNKLSSPLTGASVGTTVTTTGIGSLGFSLIADSTTGLTAGMGYEANYTASAEL